MCYILVQVLSSLFKVTTLKRGLPGVYSGVASLIVFRIRVCFGNVPNASNNLGNSWGVRSVIFRQNPVFFGLHSGFNRLFVSFRLFLFARFRSLSFPAICGGVPSVSGAYSLAALLRCRLWRSGFLGQSLTSRKQGNLKKGLVYIACDYYKPVQVCPACRFWLGSFKRRCLTYFPLGFAPLIVWLFLLLSAVPQTSRRLI